MVERKLTGAHYGLRDWAMQRATAVIMLIYTVVLLVVLFTLPKEYSAWQAFFNQTWGVIKVCQSALAPPIFASNPFISYKYYD